MTIEATHPNEKSATDKSKFESEAKPGQEHKPDGSAVMSDKSAEQKSKFAQAEASSAGKLHPQTDHKPYTSPDSEKKN